MVTKASPVNWSVQDHLLIFKAMKKHFKDATPPNTYDIDLYQTFINVLPEKKHKFLHYSVTALLRKGYESWNSGATETEWFYASKQHHNDKNKRPPVPVVIKPVTKQPIKIELLDLLQEKTILEPVVEIKQPVLKSIEEPILLPNVEVSNVSDKLDKLTSMVATMANQINNNQGNLIDFITNSFEEVKKTSPDALFVKTAKAVVETSKAYLKSQPIKAFGETEARISTSSLMPSDVILGSNILKEYIESKGPAVKDAFADVLAGPLVQVQKPLSEEDVRRIVRDEIEKIFGPTTTPVKEKKEEPHAQVIIPVIKPPVFVKAEQVLKAVLTEEKTVQETKQKFKVLVFGLTKPQINRIIEKVSNNILIEGHEVYNNSTRDKAKRSDLVVVSRFSSHATYETLRSACGLDKVVFVSGGVSMIQKKIVSLIDAATVSK